MPALHLQGINVPDMLTVVQWRVPKDLNTLMQHFGCVGQDFLLQAVGILLAELRWFLEDHQKRLERKRKQSQKSNKNVSRLRTDTGARTSDVGSSDDESGSEGQTGVDVSNKNNSILTGNREGASDVEEAIKSINVTAGGTGRGCKQTTDMVMWLFINTHLLCGRRHCHCFHSNHYYGTADIHRSFILDLRLYLLMFVFSSASTVLCSLHAQGPTNLLQHLPMQVSFVHTCLNLYKSDCV